MHDHPAQSSLSVNLPAPAIDDGATLQRAVLQRKLASRVQRKGDPKVKTTGAAEKITVGGHDVLIFLPAGGLSAIDPTQAVDAFMFFHGKDNDYATTGDNAATSSHFAQHIAGSGQGKKNLIGLLPDAGKAASSGWAGIKAGGFEAFALQALAQLSKEIGGGAALTLGNVSLAGHSAGGTALGQAAADFGDHATDVTLQDAGYGWGDWLKSWTRLRDWFLSPHDMKKGARTLRIITKDGTGAAGTDVSTRSVLTRSEGINKAALMKRISELAAQPSHAHLAGATVAEHIFTADTTARSVATRLESKLDVTTGGGALGEVLVFTMSVGHSEVRDKTMEALVKGKPHAGEDFAATGGGAVNLTELQAGDYLVTDANAMVRQASDLTRQEKSGGKPVKIPKGAEVHVSEFQHGALHAYNDATDAAQGYGVFAMVDGHGWTLLSNLKAKPPKPTP